MQCSWCSFFFYLIYKKEKKRIKYIYKKFCPFYTKNYTGPTPHTPLCAASVTVFGGTSPLVHCMFKVSAIYGRQNRGVDEKASVHCMFKVSAIYTGDKTERPMKKHLFTVCLKSRLYIGTHITQQQMSGGFRWNEKK